MPMQRTVSSLAFNAHFNCVPVNDPFNLSVGCMSGDPVGDVFCTIQRSSGKDAGCLSLVEEILERFAADFDKYNCEDQCEE